MQGDGLQEYADHLAECEAEAEAEAQANYAEAEAERAIEEQQAELKAKVKKARYGFDCMVCDSAMLCVNIECTIYRCPICGRGYDTKKMMSLETSRKM